MGCPRTWVLIFLCELGGGTLQAGRKAAWARASKQSPQGARKCSAYLWILGYWDCYCGCCSGEHLRWRVLLVVIVGEYFRAWRWNFSKPPGRPLPLRGEDYSSPPSLALPFSLLSSPAPYPLSSLPFFSLFSSPPLLPSPLSPFILSLFSSVPIPSRRRPAGPGFGAARCVALRLRRRDACPGYRGEGKRAAQRDLWRESCHSNVSRSLLH